jgi:hypothetical protein
MHVVKKACVKLLFNREAIFASARVFALPQLVLGDLQLMYEGDTAVAAETFREAERSVVSSDLPAAFAGFAVTEASRKNLLCRLRTPLTHRV